MQQTANAAADLDVISSRKLKWHTSYQQKKGFALTFYQKKGEKGVRPNISSFQ
jgi:hypothetical protein